MIAVARRAARTSLAIVLAAAGGAPAQEPPGGALYQKYCSQCHGANGDGQGVAASRLMPRPRDFTAGKFKVRTTPNGALPTDDDLLGILRDGMPYTSMPGWSHLPDAQLREFVEAVKGFAPGFADPNQKPAPIELPRAPKPTPESIAEGAEVYERIGCAACHGELGRGDGRSAPSLKDDWGDPIRPADLSKRWTFRGGSSREDIYRTLSTGMNGTPMPSFAESLTDEERWRIVDFISGLDPRDEPGYAELVKVAWSDEELDLERGEALFADAPPAYFSVIGQVTEPGRAFHPAANGVTVRAVYNRREIAFLLTWHDMREDTGGHNAPELPVPEEEAAPDVDAGDDGGGFWGEEAAPAEEGGGDFWGEAAAPVEEASGGDFWGEDAAPADEAAGDDFWGDAGAAAAPATSGTEFSDAVAIQLPAELPSGVRKPYFLFGDAQNAVDLWFLDLASKRPQRYRGAGSTSLSEIAGQDVAATARYDRGEWSVIFKRAARAGDGVSFTEDQYVPIAVSIWDGTENERGNKRGLTQWKYLYTMPRTTPSPVGPMIRTAFAVLLVELALVAWVRRRRRATPEEAEVHV